MTAAHFNQTLRRAFGLCVIKPPSISCMNFVVKEVEEEEEEEESVKTLSSLSVNANQPCMIRCTQLVCCMEVCNLEHTVFPPLVSSSSVSSAAALREAIEAFGDILF